MPTYRTLKPQGDGTRSAPCPFCSLSVRVRDLPRLPTLAACEHLVRRWRVTADQRVRVEFDQAGRPRVPERVYTDQYRGKELPQ